MNKVFASELRPQTTNTAAQWTPMRILLAIGGIGPVLFFALATFIGLLDPNYDVRTRAISELAVGPNGWLQTANFYIFGVAIIAFAVGLYGTLERGSRVATFLLVVTGLGIIGSGVFPTDLKGAVETDAGGLHNLLFLVLLLALIISYPFSAWGFCKQVNWRGFMWVTALFPLVVFGLLAVFIGFSSDVGDPLYAVGGLVQRVLLGVAFGWMTVTAWRLLYK